MDWQTCKELLEHAPFTMGAMGMVKQPQIKPAINVTRMAEAVVIALLTAGAVGIGGYLIAWPALKQEVENIRREIQEVRSDIREDKESISVLRERAARLEGERGRNR